MAGMADSELLVAGQAVSLRSLVADRLRHAIVTGRFPPGSQLRERELCELTGVSRPSVREALRQLEAEGLVSAATNRGLVVTQLTPDEVTHIYALRRVLERYAAREFARLRSSVHIEELRSAIERLDMAQAKSDPLTMLDVGTDIHMAIARGSGNPYIAESLGSLYSRIAHIRYISLHEDSRVVTTFDELRELSAAIMSGDEGLAERLCDQHLDDISSQARTVVEAGYALP